MLMKFADDFKLRADFAWRIFRKQQEVEVGKTPVQRESRFSEPRVDGVVQLVSHRFVLLTNDKWAMLTSPTPCNSLQAPGQGSDDEEQSPGSILDEGSTARKA